MPAKVVSSLPILPIIYQDREFYSLFKKIDNRWFQVRVQSYPVMTAIKVWADFITDAKTYSIRKARFDYNEAR